MRVISYSNLRRVTASSAVVSAIVFSFAVLVTPEHYPADACPNCAVMPAHLSFKHAALVIGAPDRITTRADGELHLSFWPTSWFSVPAEAEDYGRPCDKFDVAIDGSELKFAPTRVTLQVPCSGTLVPGSSGRTNVAVSAAEPGIRRFAVSSRGQSTIVSIAVMSRWYVHWIVVDVVTAILTLLAVLMTFDALKGFWSRVLARVGIVVTEPGIANGKK